MAQVIGRFGGGGAQRLAYNLAVGLASQGVRSCGIALRGRTADAAVQEAGAPVLELGAKSASPLALIGAAHRLRRIIRERQVGIVHVHGRDTLPFCALVLLGMGRPPRLVFTWHDSEVVLAGGGVRLATMRWALGRCDSVLGSSRKVVEQLNARGRLGRPAQVFRNGVPSAPSRARPEGEAVILWMARFTPAKDPHILIRAVARLRDQGLVFRVVLAGAAPANLAWFQEQVTGLVRELGLEDRVSMPGWVDDARPLLEQAAIAVQTSLTEGLSMALLEQMMAGIPVVATDVGDTSAAVIDGQTGLLVPARDEAALTAALARLLKDPEERAQMGAAAHARAAAEFSLERMAQRAVAEYRRIAEAP